MATGAKCEAFTTNYHGEMNTSGVCVKEANPGCGLKGVCQKEATQAEHEEALQKHGHDLAFGGLRCSAIATTA